MARKRPPIIRHDGLQRIRHLARRRPTHHPRQRVKSQVHISMAVRGRSRGAVRALPDDLPEDEEAEGVQTGVDVVDGERGAPVADPEREGGLGDVVVE